MRPVCLTRERLPLSLPALRRRRSLSLAHLIHNYTRNPALTTQIDLLQIQHNPIGGVQLGGKPLKLVNEAKYLGVTLDSKLNWGKHIRYVCEKAINTYWACRRAFGNTWGLSPDNVRCMYEAIIRPRLTHGALVWWQKCSLKTHQSSLAKVQRLTIGSITGSPSTTPLAALELILGIPSLQAFIKGEANKSWWRIRQVIETGGELDQELGQVLPLISKHRGVTK